MNKRSVRGWVRWQHTQPPQEMTNSGHATTTGIGRAPETRFGPQSDTARRRNRAEPSATGHYPHRALTLFRCGRKKSGKEESAHLTRSEHQLKTPWGTLCGYYPVVAPIIGNLFPKTGATTIYM